MEQKHESPVSTSKILDHLNEGVVILSHEHRVIYANEAGLRPLGVSRPQLIGRDFREFLTDESGQNIHDAFRIQDSDFSGIEFRIRTPDRTEIHAHGFRENETLLLFLNGKAGPHGLGADRENRLRCLFEKSLIGVALGSLDGIIHDANPAYLQLVEYSESDLKAAAISWEKLTPVEFRSLTYRHLARLQTEDTVLFEKEYQTRNGRRIPVLVEVSVYDRLRGSYIEFVVDMTLKRELEQSTRRLLQAQEALTERELFSAVASHELKQPLAVLNMQIQLIERATRSSDVDPEFSSRILRLTMKAHEASDHAVRLIDELMDITSIRSRRLVLKKKPTDLILLAKSVIETVTDERYRSQGMITVHGPETLQANVDPVRVEQVLMNLISNAIKYGLGLPIRILLSREPECIRIAVCDRGQGIPEADRENIFERYERIGAERRNIEGLGLGLFIARGIVSAHGGEIWVEENEGGGSCFHLTLQDGES